MLHNPNKTSPFVLQFQLKFRYTILYLFALYFQFNCSSCPVVSYISLLHLDLPALWAEFHLIYLLTFKYRLHLTNVHCDISGFSFRCICMLTDHDCQLKKRHIQNLNHDSFQFIVIIYFKARPLHSSSG
jgi:hypothetical protein